MIEFRLLSRRNLSSTSATFEVVFVLLELKRSDSHFSETLSAGQKHRILAHGGHGVKSVFSVREILALARGAESTNSKKNLPSLDLEEFNVKIKCFGDAPSTSSHSRYHLSQQEQPSWLMSCDSCSGGGTFD